MFEKVGEATETALITLAEKINPYGVAKTGGRLESAKAVRKDMEGKWKKDFTLEFSRDRWWFFYRSFFADYLKNCEKSFTTFF